MIGDWRWVITLKEGGVGPEALREREHGHRGESRILQQLPEGVVNVVHVWNF
jgi:hypothetical protein